MRRPGIFRTLAKRPEWNPNEQGIFVCPLRSFTSEFNTVRLPDGVVIRRSNQADAARLKRASQLGFGVPLFSSSTPFVIESRERGGTMYEAITLVDGRYRRAILALRLLQSGGVALGFNRVAHQPRNAGYVQETFASLRPMPDHGFGAEYPLRKGQIRQLKQVHEKLPSDFHSLAPTAFSRFDLAHGRQLQQDRLIDFWVGLEALFSDGQELTYKLAMRISHFIGEGPDQRLALFSALKRAYRIRSEVVHGRGSSKEIAEAERVSSDALRDSLRRIVLEGKEPNIEELDNIAARGRPR